MVNFWYDGYTYCSRCNLLQSIVRLRCEICNSITRRNSHHRKNYRAKRYGIAFIPTAIIVVSSLYNIVFI